MTKCRENEYRNIEKNEHKFGKKKRFSEKKIPQNKVYCWSKKKKRNEK